MAHTAYPIDDPIQALIRDHNLIRKLAAAYLHAGSQAVKTQAATQLIEAIDAHSRLEEGVFYPGVRRVDPNLVASFEEDHLAVDDLLAALRKMSMADTRAEPLVREMIAAMLSHIQEEEAELFSELRRAAIDLSPVGLEMEAFEANLVHRLASASERWVRR